eukprot:TRINITY_DN28837_c0_g1_i1.p1 TRINITY_DN28837_c0_g1~~TRINITY_DN28837_c0_g1_i1.p1  ORF type:complete len:103 (+),score=24.63 TRINITY_DN28837_c0_g1_i1:129-437(+)
MLVEGHTINRGSFRIAREDPDTEGASTTRNPLWLSDVLTINSNNAEKGHHHREVTWMQQLEMGAKSRLDSILASEPKTPQTPEIGRAVQQECRDRSRMPSSA